MTNEHPNREEDFDLYALGALEGEEKRAIETHVASCSDCAQKLAEANGRIALLALTAPQLAPSPEVKVRLMRKIREEAAGAVVAGAARAGREPEHAGGFFGRWWMAVLVPAAAALAIATLVLWTQNRALNQQLAGLRASMEQQEQQLAEARQVADLVSARDTIVVPLAAQPGTPKGTAIVLFNQKTGLLSYQGELEAAPADKSYQLWLVPTQGNPISAGVFTPGSNKTNHFTVKLPPGVTPKAFAVTLEPAGGRPQPTGAKVLVGAA